ncbi:MAG: amidohydrolase family protein [Bacteroidetes bacterium]|nr:amidohydrolase family protein [Bacteroidota bacterium]
MDPDNYEDILVKFPKLKICFAHMGFDSAKKLNNLTWFTRILALMKMYPNVYMDVSYTASYENFCPWFIAQYNAWSPDIQDRVIFGTDFYMTVQEVNGNDNEVLDSLLMGLGEVYLRNWLIEMLLITLIDVVK